MKKTLSKPSEKLLPSGAVVLQPNPQRARFGDSHPEEKLLPSMFDQELTKALDAKSDRELLLPVWFNDCDC